MTVHACSVLFRVPDVFNYTRPVHFHMLSERSRTSTSKINDTYPLKAFTYYRPYYTNFFADAAFHKKVFKSHPSYENSGSLFLLHNPLAVPSLDDTQVINYFYSSIAVYVTAEITEIGETIKDYSIERRQCYYAGEKVLKFFKIYTKSSCVYECMSNYTMKACGCVQFFMIRELF